MDKESKNNNENEKKIYKVFYGIADFKDNKIIILIEPSDNSDTVIDDSVLSPLNFDKIIETPNKTYISYITISGIRRYSLIKNNDSILATYKRLDKDTYMWNIFKIYRNHYVTNYKKPEIDSNNNKKSLSTFIKTLYINLQPKSINLCAQFVHWALNVSGFKFQGKDSAKLYHTEGLLKELGFYEIPQNSELKKGDIAVKVNEELVNNKDYYGHICAWDGQFWLCDYKSKILNYSKNWEKSTHYYRYDLWDE